MSNDSLLINDPFVDCIEKEMGFDIESISETDPVLFYAPSACSDSSERVIIQLPLHLRQYASSCQFHYGHEHIFLVYQEEIYCASLSDLSRWFPVKFASEEGRSDTRDCYLIGCHNGILVSSADGRFFLSYPPYFRSNPVDSNSNHGEKDEVVLIRGQPLVLNARRKPTSASVSQHGILVTGMFLILGSL